MPKLHPQTQQFLANVERLLPTPPSTGYYPFRFVLDEKILNTKPVGYPFYYKIKKYFTVEEVKSGRFLDMIRLEDSPKEYAFFVSWKATSTRFGAKLMSTPILFFFTIQRLETGTFLKFRINK